jgi:hypothetical protein
MNSELYSKKHTEKVEYGVLNKLIKRYVSEEDEAKLIKIKSKNGCTTF